LVSGGGEQKMALKRFNAFNQSKSLSQKAKIASDVYREMRNESGERAEVEKANAITRTDAVPTEAMARRLLLLRRKKLTKESASSQYECDGAVYEPYKTAREKKTGKFTDVKRAKR